MWKALPGVDKRLKVGDRKALIDELWSAIERLPDPEPRADPKRPSKQDVVIAKLCQPEGATVDEVASVSGWQRHTVERQSPSRPQHEAEQILAELFWKRDSKFESISLQQRVCELSVPERRTDRHENNGACANE